MPASSARRGRGLFPQRRNTCSLSAAAGPCRAGRPAAAPRRPGTAHGLHRRSAGSGSRHTSRPRAGAGTASASSAVLPAHGPPASHRYPGGTGGERPDRRQLPARGPAARTGAPVARTAAASPGTPAPSAPAADRELPQLARTDAETGPPGAGSATGPQPGARIGLQRGQRGHGDRRLARARRVLGHHAEQQPAGHHRGTRHPRPLRLAQRVCRAAALAGHWSPAPTATHRPGPTAPAHPRPHPGLPHHGPRRDRLLNAGYPTAWHPSTGSPGARPGPPPPGPIGGSSSIPGRDLDQRQIRTGPVRIAREPRIHRRRMDAPCPGRAP